LYSAYKSKESLGAHSTCGWQLKLCDPSLTCALPECLSGELLSTTRDTNVLFTHLMPTLHYGNEAKLTLLATHITVMIK